MKAIITGSSGFVGSHFCKLLKEKNIETSTIGTSQSSQFSSTHLTIQNGSEKQEIKSFIKSVEPDFFFHFAGVVEFDDQKRARQANVEYCKVILESLNELNYLKKTRFITLGSAAEYGLISPENLPVSEEYNESPSDLYGKSKLEQTRLVTNFHNELQYLIFRPFTLIGRGMPGHLAIGSFANQINSIITEENRSPELKTGYLGTSRDFLGVTQATTWIWQVSQTPKAYRNTYNLCSGSPTKIVDILNFLISVSKKNISTKQSVIDKRKINMMTHYGDCSKLLSVLSIDEKPEESDWKYEAEQMITAN